MEGQAFGTFNTGLDTRSVKKKVIWHQRGEGPVDPVGLFVSLRFSLTL